MFARRFAPLLFFLAAAAVSAGAQELVRPLAVKADDFVEIINKHGRVSVNAAAPSLGLSANPTPGFRAIAAAISQDEILVQAVGGKTKLTVAPASGEKRIDLVVHLPEGVKIRIQTAEGEITLRGQFKSVAAVTETGTVAAYLPPGQFEYEFLWTASRPRFMSEFPLENVKEKPGGKFLIKGKLEIKDDQAAGVAAAAQADGIGPLPAPEKIEGQGAVTSLSFTTARGIVLLNIPVAEVPSNLRERPLTRAAKAIVMGGDAALSDAIRRASPKYFSEFEKTLPRFRKAPGFAARESFPANFSSGERSVIVRVIDRGNRALSGLGAADFEVTENNLRRNIISVAPVASPINIVLVLDVSGSVDNYVNFIRKAARNFVETVEKGDRIAIVLFNDDVQVLSNFSSDKAVLSKSLDSFDAGGSTAYYDALGFVLSDTLQQLRGDRTAIVALTDGDDNRSFLPFESLFNTIDESGAIIYPLYVPSALIAATPQNDFNAAIDPLRSRYIALTSKAQGEGKRLAEISGGIYFPITRLSEIQKAYNDIVSQMRTAYRITYRTEGDGPAPRVRIRVARPNAFVQLFPQAER
ncbi:MAG TPA: hypothetical protein DEA22_07450 [Blastocatellia bacterium]|nr:hypothetical protein [Blastocatellia bacterium]